MKNEERLQRCQGTAPPFMNGYAESGLPRMRTAFARIVPVSSDTDARPDGGRATLQEKYDKKGLGSFPSTVYGARER